MPQPSTVFDMLLAELDAFMATAKFSKGVTSTATGMLILSAAIKVLASVVSDLAKLQWEQLAKGLVGVGVLLAEVDLFPMKTLRSPT